MRRVEKISIVQYILRWLLLIQMFFILFLLVLVTLLSQGAIRDDVRKTMGDDLIYFSQNMIEENGRISVSADFLPESHLVILVLDEEGSVLYGEYPQGMEEYVPAGTHRSLQRLVCGKEIYYMMDRGRHQDKTRKSRLIVRGVLNAKDVDSVYEDFQRYAYCSVPMVIIITLLFGFFLKKRLSVPMVELCKNMEKIGEEMKFSDHVNYDGHFYELDLLAKEHNHLLDCMEQALEQQKQFVSDVSHELRTPLAVIQAQCQLCEEKRKKEPELEKCPDMERIVSIQNQTVKMKQLMEQLLKLSRLDQNSLAFHKEKMDLSVVVESVCEEEFQQSMDRFVLHLKEAVAMVDIGLIMIVIRNLLSNAVKYSSEQSAIEITTGYQGEYVFVKVRDYGLGMSQEEQKKIFDRFYRADKARKSGGFGLGLSLADEIVRKHGGSIQVESESGKGSTFVIFLPQK